jgi:hypothetical protein
MLCFLPPLPAARREPLPEPGPQQPARAAQTVILIFVILNVIFVLTGLLPLIVKMEGRSEAEMAKAGTVDLCAERQSVGLPQTLACRGEIGTSR